MQYLSTGEMSLMEKLHILTDAAKYDVACTSSGVERKGNGKDMGSSSACGICHSFSSDGRCISLLKILFTNECIYDCKYCLNRKSNDVERATFTPREICELTMQFYRRNYIEGLFLSSGIIQNPNYTMELIYTAIFLLLGIVLLFLLISMFSPAKSKGPEQIPKTKQETLCLASLVIF